IPKGILVQLSGRDWKIYHEFNGNNHKELARKYGVSVPWVYQIIKRVHKMEVAKRQIDLFNE
ncbi:Mor transcription activator family protein, partial [Ursidibacter sp. B-7004-1]